jgi:two-component system alkaline phosphatase synthesis response regulator PhoP
MVDVSTPDVRRRILVVDDDASTRTFLRDFLTIEGYAVEDAATAPQALRQVAHSAPDLVLLDVMMPGQDGLDALAVLRRTSDVPVILLTAKDGESDRVVGLRLGADDYVVKPFSPAELAARIATVLRRARPSSPSAPLDFGGLRIDETTHRVTARGRTVDLPAREYEMLVFLASAPRQAFSRDQLLERVWGSSADRQGVATVTEHVRRIRSRIEEDPERPRWIRTVRGVGYRFDP